MTAATPRVRVTMKGPGRIAGRLVAEYRCGACGRAGWNDHQTILERAVDHAATCPALRLAALLARLEGLRDFYRLPWRVPTEAIADDLDGIILEATR